MHLPLVWALGFANVPLLYALAAASVPIMIHLLNRRKFREVPWAAMRFLLAAIRKNRRRIRIEQWLLLAIRTLIVLLVVSAMAKPFLETFGAVIAGPADAPGARARRLAEHGLHVGRVEPVRPGQGARGPARQGLAPRRRHQRDPDGRPAPGRDRRPLAQPRARSRRRSTSSRSRTAAPTWRPPSRQVDRVLDASPITQKEVIFLTDLQAASWRPPAEAADGAQAHAGPARGPTAALGRDRPGQVGRREPRGDRPEARRRRSSRSGTPALIRAVLHNFGSTRGRRRPRRG